ncbi:MAG TPA: helix-turn-helix domain-containing protein [Candidatus Limnocylindrales bacterium]|jgi:excisionase family DNA binding protein|nr:helix-turn-helix domain-containing protein [Candidatus Limnocylindrales bacterium]HZM08780.1 helix-turn-helix domain-containing protein [Candidatus Limnocylindrales bacterium]
MATGGCNSRKSLEMEWLDLHALTKYAAVSERTIREWIHLSHNALPAVQVGKKLLVRRSDFDAWLENHRFRPIESINVTGIVNELLSELVETE